MPIPGTITILQPLAPNTEGDTTPITNPKYGLGGLRSVGTTADRNEIPQTRRDEGMMVYVKDADIYYALVGGTGNENWIEFTPSGLGTQGATGATGPPGTGSQLVIIKTFCTTLNPLIMKGVDSYSLSGNTITLSYEGPIVPATGSVYLTDPTKGSGFPAYFSNAGLTSITFSGQSITAGIGETVTLRVMVTGSQNGIFDKYDYTVQFENQLRWGKSSEAYLNTSAGISAGLTSYALISEPQYDFFTNAGAGQYIFLAYPSRLGQSFQSINNAAYGGMGRQGSRGIPGQSPVLFTNVLGFSESFYVYRSEKASLGSNLTVKITPIA
jgi:hypothetical protein